jgi:pimeloyl-ACP methyl ester carboxylesterase
MGLTGDAGNTAGERSEPERAPDPSVQARPGAEQAGASVYRSPAARARVLKLYDAYIAGWPVPLDEADVDTRFGAVHVLICGPSDGRPVLLLHAASMASTSWRPNVVALSEAGFRLYAPDHIGEAGKSRLREVGRYPRTPQDVGSLYLEIAERLAIDACPVVGASAGGHAALRYALAAPDRVTALALLGPMGITSLSLAAMARMMVASLVPTETVSRATSRWALGSAPTVVNDYGVWFSTVMRSMATPPRVARPVALEPEELRRITQPVLLVLGSEDNLVGDPERASSIAAALPNARINTLRSGHLLGVERADEVNALLVPFLQAAGS